MARVLLADGRAADVERMVAPLLEKAEADDDDQRTLHVLIARIDLLHHGRPEAAYERLPALPEATPETRTVAEVVLWRAWALLETDEHPAPRALRLLDRAAQAFRRLAEPTGLAWARIGQARAYLRIDEPALAHLPFRQASILQASLQSAPMREWIHRLGQVLPEPLPPRLLPEDVVAADAAMQGALEALPALAQTRLPVLLSGEPGTGKAYLARVLHDLGPSDPPGPFVALDCTGAPPELVTGRLLGEPGRAGALQEAKGGTLFLRAVDRLPRAAQEGLLAHLEKHRFDARLLASTHRDIAAEARADCFLEPLLDALAPAKLHLPPLRARRLDIALLARRFLDTCPSSAPCAALTDRAQEALLRYDWPGNVRQLRNEIERALVLLQSEPAPVIDLAALSPALSAEVLLTNGAASAPSHTLDAALARAEKTLIERVLRAQGGQVSASADILGLTRQGLYKKMKRLDIDATHFQAATG